MVKTLLTLVAVSVTPSGCWDAAKAMEAQQISKESIEAYLTKCLVGFGKTLNCEPDKKPLKPSQEMQAKQ
jgi:hypothetical protein